MTTAGASPTAAAQMQPDPSLDLSSPRVKAAMRELGILPSELIEPDPNAPASPNSMLSGSASDLVANGIMKERKRRDLRLQVAQLAARTEKKKTLAKSNTALDRDLKAAQDQMDRMQQTARRMTQDLVVKELERKLIEQDGHKKLEESKAAFNKFIKEQEEKRKAERKATESKNAKMQEAIQKNRAREEEHLAEVKQKFTEAQERNAANQAKAESERQQTSPPWNFTLVMEMRKEREEKVAKQEEEEYQKRAALLQRFEAKHSDKLQRNQEELEKIRNAARTKSAIAMEKLNAVRERQKGDEVAEEQRRKECLAKLEQAKAKREAKHEEVKKAAVAKNLKVQSAHAKLLESVMAQEAEHQKAVADAYAKKLERMTSRPKTTEDLGASLDMTGSPTSMSRSISAGGFSIETARRREEHRQIAQQNRERLARQELFREQKQRAKFDQMLRRSKLVQDKKRQAIRLKQDLQKGCITERDNLAFEFNRAKSSPANKMVPLIERLRPDSGAAKHIDQMLRRLGVDRPGAHAEEEDEK